MNSVFERVNLPSNGQIYVNSLSCGKINLHYLTGKHEELLSNNSLKRGYYSMDLLLQDVIENDDVDINQLLQGDVEGILLALKVLAHGAKREISLECPFCGSKNSHMINLLDFKPIEVNIPNKMEYSYKNYIIHFQPYTYGIFKKCESKSDLPKKIITKIIDLGTEKNVDIDEFFSKKFLYSDYKQFVKFLEHSFPHITPFLNISCSDCFKSILIPFRIDPNFFGYDSQYRIQLHKEICRISYLSNGSMTISDIYNMPVHLRTIYTNELVEIKKEEEKSSKSDNTSSPKLARPGIAPK